MPLCIAIVEALTPVGPYTAAVRGLIRSNTAIIYTLFISCTLEKCSLGMIKVCPKGSGKASE